MIIIHYIPSIDESSGGVGAYMQLTARDLGQICDLHIITHKSNEERTLDNCTVHYIPEKWVPWDSCKAEFNSLLSEIHPDVFHTNSCWSPLSSLTAQWAKAAGYKVVYTPHGMLEPYALKRNYWTKKLPAILLYQKLGIQSADLIHATADTERENLLKLGWNINISVIPNCVQIDEIEIKSSWKRNKNILFLSRVHPKKGVDFLIEAVSQMKDDFEGYTFTIAGIGEETYLQELKRLASLKEVADMFDFVGPVFGNKKWALFRKADLFVLPTHSENFGIVVTEALASGTPVVTTFGTPWAELNGEQNTIDSRCGWCVDIGAQSLIEALKDFLLCSEKDLETMGRRGRKLVEEKYSSDSVAKQFEYMYKGLVCQNQ